MKYILVLYLCSMNTGQCPSSQIAGYQFNTHYDCVNAGYAVAQKTYRDLKEYEEYPVDVIEKNKIVIKFECRKVGTQT